MSVIKSALQGALFFGQIHYQMSSEPLTTAKLADRIRRQAALSRSVLFAGAGISARVGIPIWKDLLIKLAEVCTEYGDELSAKQIEKKASAGDYLGAASIYKLCTDIPQGESLKRLVSLLSPKISDQNLDKLTSLLGVGFEAAVTTNFDRVLHDVYARTAGRSARALELDDDTFKATPMLSEFYVARIHGRIEKPEKLILDVDGYKSVQKNGQYLDFLIALLTQRPCCFIGFSFYDPAIENILSIYNEKYGPNPPHLHLAVIPSSASKDLGLKLRQVNIEVVYYDPKNNHHDLWQALREASIAKETTAIPQSNDTALEANFPRFKRFAAFNYAQLATRSHQAPLIETSKQAIAFSVIEQGGKKGKEDHEYHADITGLLHLGLEAAGKFFVEAASGLVASGYVDRKHGRLVIIKKIPDLLEEKLHKLCGALVDRIRVLTGERIPEKYQPHLSTIIEKVFLARAWDLAAFYAGAKIGYPADLLPTIDAVLDEAKMRGEIPSVGSIRIGLGDFLQRPTDSEAKILAEIGRAAFAIQILFSSPRQALRAQFLLPSRIYLDSNFLMPAIVPGHPTQQLYAAVLDRVKLAAKQSNLSLELVVAFQFANEIVAHRDLAIQTVRRLALEEPENMRRHVAMMGAHNGNVFVSAYASAIGRAHRKTPFADFLKSVAPYKNEKELEEFLKGRGVKVVIQDPKKFKGFEKIKTLLEIGYAHGDIRLWASKEPVLVSHEAAQLAQLMSELESNVHSLFITADLRLANVIYTDNHLRALSGAIMSGFGFVGMVDLLLGVKVDAQSFTRLVWSSPKTSDEERLRDFLLQRALAEYDSALTRKMPEIIDASVSAAKEEVERRGIKLSDSGNVETLVKTHDVMDRMEDHFFENMKEAMDKDEGRKKGSG